MISDQDPRVRTRNGVVRGRWQGETTAFLGIPYACAPIGDRRFGPQNPPSCRCCSGLRTGAAEPVNEPGSMTFAGPLPGRARTNCTELQLVWDPPAAAGVQ